MSTAKLTTDFFEAFIAKCSSFSVILFLIEQLESPFFRSLQIISIFSNETGEEYSCTKIKPYETVVRSLRLYMAS